MLNFFADFHSNYYSEACESEHKQKRNQSQNEFGAFNIMSGNLSSYSLVSLYLQNQTSNVTLVVNGTSNCNRENSILYLLLMFGTLWLGVMLYNFNKT